MVVFFLSGINLSIFLTFNPPIYRIGNAPNILCSRYKEQDESHPHFTFNCKISKNTLYLSELHKVSLNFVSRFNKLQDAATELSSKGFTRTWNPLLNYNRSFSILSVMTQSNCKNIISVSQYGKPFRLTPLKRLA